MYFCHIFVLNEIILKIVYVVYIPQPSTSVLCMRIENSVGSVCV